MRGGKGGGGGGYSKSVRGLVSAGSPAHRNLRKWAYTLSGALSWGDPVLAATRGLALDVLGSIFYCGRLFS